MWTGPNPGFCPSCLPLPCSSSSSSSPCRQSWRILAGIPSHSVLTAPRSSDRPSTRKRPKRYRLYRYDLHHQNTLSPACHIDEHLVNYTFTLHGVFYCGVWSETKLKLSQYRSIVCFFPAWHDYRLIYVNMIQFTQESYKKVICKSGCSISADCDSRFTTNIALFNIIFICHPCLLVNFFEWHSVFWPFHLVVNALV